MWNLKQFKDIYARYQSSGLHVDEFCRNECIVRSRFYYWQRKLRKSVVDPVQSPGFVPVVLSGNGLQPQVVNLPSRQPSTRALPADGEVYEIVYPGGVVLRVSCGTDLKQLRSLIHLTRQDHV
ncbi:MAG: hypothetical protein WCZ43_12765 [Proteiniphilum sp.]